MLRRCFLRFTAIPGTLEWNRLHHLQNSLPVGSPFLTKCGRTFDPVVYVEMMQAMCDQKWITAIQRNLRQDVEYQTMLRTTGGGSLAFDALARMPLSGDQEAFDEMKVLMEADAKAALSVCAMLDAFKLIKDKRDHYKTEVAAGDHAQDLHALPRSMQEPFGQRSI